MPGAYKACGASRPVIHFDEEASVLRVTGVVIDRVSYYDSTSHTDMDQCLSLVQSESEILENIESVLEEVIEEGPSS